MSEKNNAQQDGVLKRAGRWSTAAAVVGTAAAQHYVDPGSTLATALHHANTGATWGLGFQLVIMVCTAAYRALPSDGSVTLSWRVNGRKDNGDDVAERTAPVSPEEETANPTEKKTVSSRRAPTLRKKDKVSQNGEHGV
ncbi:hypothetical protein [Streptomyces mirabilis]|uniref:hypothetical protein n=1 Tax=Streptomyces mirabilis TaxID=68239 RepID=UPI00368A3B22